MYCGTCHNDGNRHLHRVRTPSTNGCSCWQASDSRHSHHLRWTVSYGCGPGSGSRRQRRNCKMPVRNVLLQRSRRCFPIANSGTRAVRWMFWTWWWSWNSPKPNNKRAMWTTSALPSRFLLQHWQCPFPSRWHWSWYVVYESIPPHREQRGPQLTLCLVWFQRLQQLAPP